jgi:Flp pilus assembly pilin Flp
MNGKWGRLARSERGQGMSEYIIIVALIAISAIAAITVFSQNVRSLFAATANELAGSSQTSAVSAGGQQGATATRKKMANFGSSGST